jgi:SAM-dependent methyltransferase
MFSPRSLLETACSMRRLVGVIGPLPPDELVIRVGVNPNVYADQDARRARFEEIGLGAYAHVLAALSPDWSWNGASVLDFGCGSGRLLRLLLPHLAEGALLTGCDIDEPSIRWLREHYPQEVRLYVNDHAPELPEPDGAFDLVCAISVFTHLTRWAEWLLELRRVLRPRGLLVATVLGRASWASGAAGARGIPWDDERTGLIVEDYGAGFEDAYGPAVFVSEWWLREHWGRALEIVRFEPQGIAARQTPQAGQTWVVARRRPDGDAPTPDELVTPGADPREVLAAQRAQWLAYEELAALRARAPGPDERNAR